MRTLVRGGQVFRGGRFDRSDIALEGEKIAEIGLELRGSFASEIDASGFWVLPGLIDIHVHFREPGLAHKEGWENGSRAAVRGGATAVFEVQNNEPLSVDAARIRQRHDLAAKGLVDFGCYGNLLPQSLPQLREMAPLVPAFKLFMGGSTGMDGIPDRKLLGKLFAAAADAGRPIVAHCEDEGLLSPLVSKAGGATAADHHRLRPPEAETRSIRTAIELAQDTGVALHIFHLSTAGGADLVEAAKSKGLSVTASVSPHNLFFSREDVARLGNRLKVNPPIQGGEDRARLREALARGVIDAVATDHAPHLRSEKERSYAEAPAGVPSVEFLLPLLLSAVDSGVLPCARAIEAASEEPARIFGIRGKGRVEPGFDADLVLIDPEASHEVGSADVVSRAGWTPYEGRRLRGFPRCTIVRGKAVFQAGRFAAGPWGRPVPF